MNKPQIAVSVLSADFGRLAEEIQTLNTSGADLYHLDIMDGHFVPNLSFGTPLVKAIAPLAKLPLDAHLMVTNPGAYIERFSQIGVKYFSFHQETVYHPHRLIQEIKAAGMKAGIALNPPLSLSS
jgi:ribulose-phosphate 3-epimerase